jgi:hypothetical protein
VSKKARRRPSWKKRELPGGFYHQLRLALRDLREGNIIETSWPEGAGGPKIVTRYVGGVPVS